MTAREVIRRLTAEGWQEVHQSGGHKIFEHPEKSGQVSVPMHPGDIKKGTLANIYRQARWR